MKKIADFKGWLRVLLIVGLILSYSLVRSINLAATYSVNSIWLCLLFAVGHGVFSWLLFELLASFFYSGLKLKIEKYLSMNQFLNIFRFVFMLVNIATYAIISLCALINFFTPYMILILVILLSFFALFAIYKFLMKHYLTALVGKDFSMAYFGFVFMYLFLMTVMWGTM